MKSKVYFVPVNNSDNSKTIVILSSASSKSFDVISSTIRLLLSELSRCAWEALRVFFREAVPQGDAMPGAVIAIQTFGDLLGFNPHCHVLCTDGCFDEKALFRVAPRFGPEGLKAIFEHKVFRMLLSKGRSPRILSPCSVPGGIRGFKSMQVRGFSLEKKREWKT